MIYYKKIFIYNNYNRIFVFLIHIIIFFIIDENYLYDIYKEESKNSINKNFCFMN